MKQSRPATLGNIRVKPMSAKQLEKIHRRVAKRHAKYRRRYPEIRGKTIDWVTACVEEGLLYIGLQFTDKTYFSLQFSPRIVTEGIEFSDMSGGDDRILKVYYRRKENGSHQRSV